MSGRLFLYQAAAFRSCIVDDKSRFHSSTPVGPVLNECKRLLSTVIIIPMLLKQIHLLPERVSDWSDYPFNVPTIASLRKLEIRKPVAFFVGENGSGKST